MIKLKKKQLRQYAISHDPLVKNLANNLHNKIKKQIKALNREKWSAIYEKLTKTNPSEKKFWNVINKKTEEEVEFLQKSSKTDHEKAEILADHMEKIYANSHSIEKNTRNCFKYYKTIKFNQPITMNELVNTIKRTTSKNSHGYDLISTKILKKLNQNCLANILKIFNASFELGYVPKCWKNAKIKMIHKRDQNPDEPSSFRPISLLSNLGKILENIINERLTIWAEKKKILINEQSGFRRNRSTQDVLFKLIETTIRNLKKNLKTCLVLFDFEKAFDSVPHKNIVIKLHKNRCPSKIGLWIKSYLEERTFQVNINDTNSSKRTIKAGIPQGGCLSALLFAIFINDIKKVLKKLMVKFALFADDISVWFAGKNNNKIRKQI